MTPKRRMILSFLNEDWQFVIPIYQRKYNWTRRNCIQLYDDLIKISKGGFGRHFFGSIVFCHVVDNEKSVIDGQQRLTTMSLLLLAIRNLLKSGEVKSAKSDILEKEIENRLVLHIDDGKSITKLRLFEADSDMLRDLVFSPEIEPNIKSCLGANYVYLRDRIKLGEISVNELYDAIEKLEIITLELDPKGGDNAQQIFESINATGAPLENRDKIRNYILMGLSNDLDEKQKELYNIWLKIEQCTTDEKVDEFITYFLNINGRKYTKSADVYLSFKNYAEEERSVDPNINPANNHKMSSFEYVKSLLNELLKFAKYYEVLRTHTCNFKKNKTEMDYCLRRLFEYGRHTTYPFFMKILERHENGELKDEEVKEIFELTESFLFRRDVCGVKTAGDNKMFISLDRTINGRIGTPDDYLSKFKYVITHMQSANFRFPDNDEFENQINEKNDPEFPKKITST